MESAYPSRMASEMAKPEIPLAEPQDRDWRLRFGIAVSAIWISLGLFYVLQVVGWSQFLDQGADRIGDFLEGGFAPLAFLWLVLGFFLQHKELTSNARAIRLQYAEMKRMSEHAETQARAIQANELHARQDTFIEISMMVQRQLGGIAGLLYVSIVGSRGAQAVTPEVAAEMWARESSDPELFTRAVLGLHFNAVQEEGSARALFFGNEDRTMHTQNFIRVFGRLIEEARACDPQGMIADAVQGSATGLLYAIMREHRDGIPAPRYATR
jgi:hypothetical protein